MDTTVLKVGKLAVHNDGNTYSVIESEQDGTCIFRKTGMCLMEAVTLFTDTFGMRANQWASVSAFSGQPNGFKDLLKYKYLLRAWT